MIAIQQAEEQHTPGPWKVVQADLHGDGEDDTRWSVLTADRDQDYFIATIENGAPGDKLATEHANAKLIAAAPLMLEILREVALPPYSDSDLQGLLETLQTRANLAIKKATE